MNEMFTEQEMAMQMKFNSLHEEAQHLHMSFNERFLCTIEESSSAHTLASYSPVDVSIDSRCDRGISSSNNNNNSGASSTSSTSSTSTTSSPWRSQSNGGQSSSHQSSTSIFSRRNFSMISLQEVILSIEESSSALMKLQVINSYCMSLRSNGSSSARELDGKSRGLLIDSIKQLLRNISINPSRFDQATLFALLNVAREDFLNIRLHGNVMNEINKIVHMNFAYFDIATIKLVFFAYAMRQKESHAIIMSSSIISTWTNTFVQAVVQQKVHERELIHFLGYFAKDNGLFRKHQVLVSNILLESFKNDGLLRGSKSPELTRQIVVLFVKSESTSHTSLEGFLPALLEEIAFLIDKKVIDLPSFHVIMRYLLRSNQLVADRMISSYDATQPDNKSLVFSAIDRFVNTNIDQLQINQALNILNLYQLVNAQNFRATALRLLDRIHTSFNSSCDNFCSFNIAVRATSLFKSPDPLRIISLFESWQNSKSPSEGSASYNKNLAHTLSILKFSLPKACFSESHAKAFEKLLRPKMIQFNDEEARKHPHLDHVLSQTPQAMHRKRYYAIEIEKIFQRIATARTKQLQHFEYFPVEFIVWNSQTESTATNTFARNEFALDILFSKDFMNPAEEILNGPLTMKYQLLSLMKVPTVRLTEEFVKDIFSIQTHTFQEQLLICQINKLLSIEGISQDNHDQEKQL